MKLTSFCIKRPVFSTILSLLIIVLGYVAFKQLQVRQYPQVDAPRVSIITQLEGASPAIIESQITKILEDALSGIEGLKMMSSSSDTGESKISLEFDLHRPIDSAVNDVRDKIGRVRNRLPQQSTEPRIRKSDANATAIMTVVLTSTSHEIEELADYAYRYLENQMTTLPGVANVDIFGGGEYEMRIILDPVAMANYRVTPNEIATAIKKQNLEKPAGKVKTRNEEIIVTTRAPLFQVQDFDNIILGERRGALVRLKDIGHAELGTVDDNSKVLFNGEPAIALSIVKQSVANPLTISKALDKKLPDIRRALLNGMSLEVAYDTTVFIEKSIGEVYETLFIASFLVVLVILLFLRSPSALVIPIVTIPVSLIGTFFLMYICGFSINILTLLALVLAIGMVVDDAIVMLENIYRYIERGMSPIQAAFKGAREISFAIIAMTITLAAVYAPIALSPGLTGRLFTEFAVTLAGAVFISGFVALTLSPMMCGRLLRQHVADSSQRVHRFFAWYPRFDAYAEGLLLRLDHVYYNSLKRFLSYRKQLFTAKAVDPNADGAGAGNQQSHATFGNLTLTGPILISAVGVAIAVLGWTAANFLRAEFVPKEDQGILNVRMTPDSPNSNLAFVSRYAAQVDALLENIPEVRNRIGLIQAPGEFRAINTLVPWEQRDRGIQEVIKELAPKAAQITGLQARVTSGGPRLSSDAATSNQPVQLVIKSTQGFAEIRQKVAAASQAMYQVAGIGLINSNSGNDAQEYEVTIDREKAASLGIDVEQVAATLDTLVGGKPVSKFRRDAKLFSVKIMVDASVQASIEDLTNVFLKGRRENQETLVPLNEVITVKKQLAPTSILHVDGMKAITLFGELKEGYGMKQTLLESIEAVEQAVADSSTQVSFIGEAKRFFEEERNIVQIFILALLFIYLVLAAQYESWRDPLIIMFSVPLSLAGGALFLLLFDQTMNLFSQIGFVTLVGLITKHGILMVDFANALKREGKTRFEAMVEAARLRLRPILMTTMAMVLGAVPLAFASGAGMESRRPIGLVIVGGMVIGTLFTLYVVPAIYTLISRKNPKPEVIEHA